MTIRTSVGCAAHGENLFRGHRVPELLRGGHGFWSLMSLAVGHRALTQDEAQFVDELGVAINASDPRIWPLKSAWLVSCHGSAWAGVGALMSWLERAAVGPWAVGEAARTWPRMESVVERGPAAILEWCHERKRTGERIPGLGVAGRTEDERLPLVTATARKFGRDSGRFYCVFDAVEQALRTSRLRANAAGGYAACLLDLGYSPEQIGWMSQPGLTLSIVANAIEASVLGPEELRQLPVSAVRYVGRSARTSPRADSEK